MQREIYNSIYELLYLSLDLLIYKMVLMNKKRVVLRILPLLSLFCCLPILSSAQIFYKSYDSKEIQDIQANGIIYIKTGTELDESIEKSLQQYWKCTKFKIIDPVNEKITLKKSDILITQRRIQNYVSTTSDPKELPNYSTYGEDILCLSTAKESGSNVEISKDNVGSIFGYISSNGFNQGADVASLKLFMPYYISGLNDYLEKIITQHVVGSFGSLNETAADAINTRVIKLQKKTLLIIDNTMGHVNAGDLTKYGIKYLFVSRSDFAQSIKEYENENYCILYRSEELRTCLAIYDMEDKKLMYTTSMKTKLNPTKSNQFDAKDMKKITQYYIPSK